jgi:hypothetical protein
MQNKNYIEATNIFFQGDLGFMKMPDSTQIPVNFQSLKPEEKGLVLAYGEVSGHAHAFKQIKDVEVFYKPTQNKDQRGYDEMYLKVKKPAILSHEEHTAILIHPGIWKKWNQKEYTFDEEYRAVAD